MPNEKTDRRHRTLLEILMLLLDGVLLNLW